MPYINQPDDEELKKQEAQAGAPTSISGQSAVLSTDAPSNKGGAKASGSYTNLNQYLDANKDNASQLGAGVANHITGQGDAARTGIQNTEADFNQLADKGTIQGLDKAPEESTNIVKQARTAGNLNQAQTSRFGEIANAQYKGPQDLTGSSLYGDTSQKYQKAQDARAAAGNEEGRFSLLKDAYARPTYSQGQQKLDNLILTGNNQAKDAVSNAASSLSDLEGKWTGAQTNAANLASQRTAASEAAKAGARQGLITNRNERSSEVDADLAAKQAAWANEYNQYNDLLSNYQGGDLELSRQQADRLALGNSGQGLYNTLTGTSPSQYLDLKAFDANKVVGQDQFAQLAALDQLGSQFGQANTSRFSDASQAGTLGLHNNFDASRFGKAVNQAETDFQNYAGNTNVVGTGQNEQSYYTGLGGTNKHWVGAGTTMDANLKNYLDTGAYNVDNRGVVRQGGGVQFNGISAPTNDSTGLAGIVSSGLNAVGDVLFNDPFGGGGKEQEAGRQAKVVSAEIAQQQFMANLNNLLGQQGYNNRVKVK